MVNRRGLGKGMGCGYRNIVPKDPLVHGLSAKGIKTWEKIGDVAKPTFQNMYGKKGKQEVVWLDNWQKGNWAVVEGKEVADNTYEETGTYGNVGTKKDALKMQREYLSMNAKSWKFTKETKFGRTDETWEKGEDMLNLHKAHKGWMVSVYRGNDVTDLFFDTEEDARTFVTVVKGDMKNFWKKVNAKQLYAKGKNPKKRFDELQREIDIMTDTSESDYQIKEALEKAEDEQLKLMLDHPQTFGINPEEEEGRARYKALEKIAKERKLDAKGKNSKEFANLKKIYKFEDMNPLFMDWQLEGAVNKVEDINRRVGGVIYDHDKAYIHEKVGSAKRNVEIVLDNFEKRVTVEGKSGQELRKEFAETKIDAKATMTVLDKWKKLPKDYKSDVAELEREIESLKRRDETLRNRYNYDSFDKYANKRINSERRGIWKKIDNSEEKLKELNDTGLSKKQLAFLKKNYSSLGEMKNVDRIYGATTRTYEVKLPEGKFKIDKDYLYGVRGSPTYISVEKV